MRRVTQLLGVSLALLASLGLLADCFGCEPMSALQRACWTARDRHCDAPSMAESCCSSMTSSRQPRLASATFQVQQPGPLSSVPAAGDLLPVPSAADAFTALEAFDRGILRLPKRPTYLLVSSFLI